jgi:hypothetical protein
VGGLQRIDYERWRDSESACNLVTRGLMRGADYADSLASVAEKESHFSRRHPAQEGETLWYLRLATPRLTLACLVYIEEGGR